MIGGRGIREASGWRLAVTRTALLLLVLRSLLPPGFMPATDALGKGRIEIVLCTGSGLKSLLVDADGVPVSPDHRVGGADDCPFGAATTTAFLLPGALPQALPAAAARDRNANPHEFALKPPAQGPPLGSRAPPFTLG